MEPIWVKKKSPIQPVQIDIVSSTNEILIHRNITQENLNGQIFYSYEELSLIFVKQGV